MDVDFQTIHCKEFDQKCLLVKLSDGSSKTFSFNVKTMAFEPMCCSDCAPTQMDSDLTPRHTEWCPHTRNTVVFAYNHVLKMELKYRFDCESGSFHEIECKECHLNPAKRTDPKQIVLVATSPKSKRAIVLTMSKKERVQKMQYDEKEKKYVDMEPTPIKSLTLRSVVVQEKETEDVTQFLEDLDLNGKKDEEEAQVMESDLIAMYKEKSRVLPNEIILVAKNRHTGEFGTYVFDRYIHQFLHVNLPDIKIDSERRQIPLQQCIVLTMSSKTQEGINLQHKPGQEGVQKYMYNRQLGIFEAMKETFVIQKATDIDKWIKKVFEECPCYTRKVHGIVDFLRNVKPYMIDQTGVQQKKPEVQLTETATKEEAIPSGITSTSGVSVETDFSEDTDNSEDSSASSSSDTETDDSDSFEIISSEELTQSKE
ncbi:hypothetical protein GCK72_002028 [Caenorhabditis remanei]|uniref:Uncharacterized protein n=1 Tax=Caenorhabditis remanei TaxID=31234 RepID=A0A6A5HPS0_CAERE|nr:hypothetical protein GCK72_002028 [Caenorhabditis remanei]KAF1770210.1 hypothetical protein GCK72_002028 [Caenorhabditis remanei]